MRLKRLNIDVKMARNGYYSRFIFERSILRPAIGTLSGGPGSVVIAVMEMEVHIAKSDLNLNPVKDFLQDRSRRCKAEINLYNSPPAPGNIFCKSGDFLLAKNTLFVVIQ